MRTWDFPAALVAFVAKTGFVTRETWEEFFFSGGKSRWRDQAWLDLNRRGCFAKYPCRRLNGVYVLNRMNREMMASLEKRAVRPPPANQLEHDDVLNRGLLRAERNGRIAHWTTEAELKAAGYGAHRVESRESLIKYPDALVHLAGQEKEPPLAIELEQTLKSRERYLQILGAYSAMSDVSGVLYICKSAVIERAVREVAERIYFPTDEIQLEFMPQEKWQKEPF